eukprot:766161-Hanusia_phi.AAC.3
MGGLWGLLGVLGPAVGRLYLRCFLSCVPYWRLPATLRTMSHARCCSPLLAWPSPLEDSLASCHALTRLLGRADTHETTCTACQHPRQDNNPTIQDWPIRSLRLALYQREHDRPSRSWLLM